MFDSGNRRHDQYRVPAPPTEPRSPEPSPIPSFALAVPAACDRSGLADERTTTLVLPPCSRSGSKTASQAAHPPGVPWRISGFPQIHRMICYSKSLKNKKERVRPQCRIAGQAIRPAQPPQNRTCELPRIRLKHRPAHTRSTAGAVRDDTSGGREHGSYPRWRGRGAPRWLVLPPCSRSGSQAAWQAAHPPSLGYLGESVVSHKFIGGCVVLTN